MNTITATAQRTGFAVDLNLDAILPQVFGLIADAFDSDPEAVAGLLADLAQSRRDLCRAQEQVERGEVPDHVAEHRGACVDRLCEDLEEQLTERLTVELTHREVLALQSQLLAASRQTLAGRVGRAS